MIFIRKNLSIVYKASLENLTEINPSFDRGILKVAYAGKNRKGSYISKDTFEKCINTIFNCPIVCNYKRETNSIGSHDMDIVKDETGNIKLVNITTPVGVVPESAKYWWEEITEPNGDVHDYLCTEVLIWKRQEAYSKIKENGITDESMEIQILDGEEIDGYYHITSFIFLAFCLLESAEPCYESACIQLFSEDKFNEQREYMMQDFKKYFSNANSQNGVHIDTTNFISEFSKGGNEMEKKLELLAQYGLTETELNFKLEDFDLNELKEKFELLSNANTSNNNSDPDVTANYSLNLEQLREQIFINLGTQTYDDPNWGECCKYYYIDVDIEGKEIFVYDATKDWSVWGFKYEMNGDNVEIDFENKRRKKFAIVDFDEGTTEANYAYAFDSIKEVYQSKCSELTAKVDTLSEQLTEFKNEKYENSISEIFENFSNLDGVEEFENLKTNHTDMDYETIEEKCYAIEGRINKSKENISKFASKRQNSVRINIEQNKAEKEPYGDLFIKYGNKN